MPAAGETQAPTRRSRRVRRERRVVNRTNRQVASALQTILDLAGTTHHAHNRPEHHALSHGPLSIAPTVHLPGVSDPSGRKLIHGAGFSLADLTPHYLRPTAFGRTPTGTAERTSAATLAHGGYRPTISTENALMIASLGIPVAPDAILAGKLLEGLVGAARGGRAAAGLARAAHAVETTKGGEAVSGALRAAGEKAGASRAGKAAKALASRAEPLAKPAGKAARFTGRHPIVGLGTANAAINVPGAIHHGDVNQIFSPGALGSLAATVGNAIPGVGGNALGDLISLPAQAIPSAYMLGAGAVEAIQGRPQRLQGMLDYMAHNDAVGALVSGHPGEALHAIGEHPLYTALELYGGAHALDKTAGAIGRRVPGVKENLDVRTRPPVQVANEIAIRRGTYSRDPLVRALQIRRDAKAIGTRHTTTSEGEQAIAATERQAKKYLRRATDTHVAVQRGKQHQNIQRTIQEIDAAAPDLKRIGEPGPDSNITSLLVQRIARSPEHFVEDLKHYRDGLEAVQHHLSPAELAGNRRMIEAIDASLNKPGGPDVEGIAHLTDTYIRQQAPVIQDLVDRGLLNKDQAEKAILFPFARLHMDAGHGLSNADQALEAEILDAMSSKPGPPQELTANAKAIQPGDEIRLIAPSGKQEPWRTVASADTRSPEGISAKSAQFVAVKFADGSSENLLGHQPVEVRRPTTIPGDPRNNLGRLNTVRARKQLLDANGDPLSAEAVKAEMARQGIEAPGFLSHKPGIGGGGDFYRHYDERASMASKRRTGDAAVKGIFDPGYDALRRQAARNQTTLDAVKSFDATTRRFVVAPEARAPDGTPARGFKDRTEAVLANENPHYFGLKLDPVPGGYVPIRLAPFLSMGSELEAALQHGSPAAIEKMSAGDVAEITGGAGDLSGADALMHKAITSALDETPGPGPYGLIPRIVAKRMAEQFAPITSGEKTYQALVGAFKGAVLPTSPGWFGGNAFDNWPVRSGLTGISPAEMRAGKVDLIGALQTIYSPDELQGLIEHTVPGGLMGTISKLQPHRDLEQMVGTVFEPVWKAAQALRRTQGLKQAGDLYAKYRDGAFAWNQKYIEQFPQFGALNKAARRDVGMTRRQFSKALQEQQPAVMKLLDGYRNTDEQIRLGQSVKAIYGNWNVMSPGARRFLSQMAPFWTWMRAATSFVFLTLPRDHPVVTGIIAAAGQMTRGERQKYGLDFGGDSPVKDFLQGGVPTGGGGLAKVGNLSSFGYTGSIPGSLASSLGGPAQSPVLAMMGLDWKGDRLANPDGTQPSRSSLVMTALLTTADQFVPFLNVGRTIGAHGPSGLSPVRTYDPSTVDYLRTPTRTLTVPITPPSSGSSSVPGSIWSGSSAPPTSVWSP